jgi:hypothetical protein
MRAEQRRQEKRNACPDFKTRINIPYTDAENTPKTSTAVHGAQKARHGAQTADGAHATEMKENGSAASRTGSESKTKQCIEVNRKERDIMQQFP